MADEGHDEAGLPTPDPAVAYPRGNRLGLRHPRPTVVIVVAVAVLVGGAALWSAVRPREGILCSVVASLGTPVAATPDAALAAWYDDGGAAQARNLITPDGGTPPPTPELADFEGSAPTWHWRHDDLGVRVDVSTVDGGYAVTAVNDCAYE